MSRYHSGNHSQRDCQQSPDFIPTHVPPFSAPSRFSTPPPNFAVSVPPFGAYHIPPLPAQPPNFSVPPPSPAPSQRILSQPNEDQQDQAWINEWLLRNGKMPQDSVSKSKVKPLTIREARQLVSSAENYLQELQAMQQNIQENINCDDPTWNYMISLINAKKQQLALVTKKVEEPDFVSRLRLMLSRRASKRMAQKRQKSERQSLRQTQMTNRQAKHLKIDEWLSLQQQVLERTKRDADTKQEADSVLGEVRLKQAEGRRLLQLLTSLKKLRHVRAQAAADKGLFPSIHEDARFEKVIEKLSMMWDSQLKNYSAEEHTLKVMLEEEAVARHGGQKRTKESDPLIQWEQLLFGRVPDAGNLEHAIHNKANTNLQELVQTREKWDQMVAAPGAVMASAPPVGWVVPVPPTSDDWSSLLVTN